ncbi:MAG TPA: ATP synthase F1 subunit delta [Longimicrobiaceae bacterium]|nr:ATP synthase F1 subunit delta [Longimicrobiaceae bacterium]
MRSSTVARNYADTLLALAERHGGRAAVEEYGRALDALAALLEGEPRLRQFLETPRVNADARKQALRAALAGRVPEMFLRFVLVMVDKRRQALLRQVAAEYRDRVDQLLDRVRVRVTLSHPPDPGLEDEIRRALETWLGRSVVPTFTVDPEIVGGVVVRVGDQILDGSVRSRAERLRRHLQGAALPETLAAD